MAGVLTWLLMHAAASRLGGGGGIVLPVCMCRAGCSEGDGIRLECEPLIALAERGGRLLTASSCVFWHHCFLTMPSPAARRPR